MHIDGPRTEEQVSGDLFVRAADGHEPDHLELAPGEAAVLALIR